MIAVADTHVALWHLFDDPRLSPFVQRLIDAATHTRQKIGLSAISLAEVVYLVEKKRIRSDGYRRLREAVEDPERVFEELPVTSTVVEAMLRIPREAVPDMPDRIIAATAVAAGVPVISRDGLIRAASLETIW